jgi:hypothetical protein
VALAAAEAEIPVRLLELPIQEVAVAAALIHLRRLAVPAL